PLRTHLNPLVLPKHASSLFNSNKVFVSPLASFVRGSNKDHAASSSRLDPLSCTVSRHNQQQRSISSTADNYHWPCTRMSRRSIAQLSKNFPLILHPPVVEPLKLSAAPINSSASGQNLRPCHPPSRCHHHHRRSPSSSPGAATAPRSARCPSCSSPCCCSPSASGRPRRPPAPATAPPRASPGPRCRRRRSSPAPASAEAPASTPRPPPPLG
ncbi:unnamed protein product, partial [Ectocarpus fasciculatus]